jgi:hypothetical protein
MWAVMSLVLGMARKSSPLPAAERIPPSGRNYEETSKTREEACHIEGGAEKKDPSSAEADLRKIPGQKR